MREKNIKDDDELEKLLGEIPHATSTFHLQEMLNNATNHHHHRHHHHNNLVDHDYDHTSCVRMNANAYAHIHSHFRGRGDSDESLKRNYASESSPMSGLSLDSGGSSSSFLSGGGRSPDLGSPPPVEYSNVNPHLISMGCDKANGGSLVDSFDLSRNLSNMWIRDEREGLSETPYYIHRCDQFPYWSKYGASDSYRNGFSYHGGPSKPMNFEGEIGSAFVQPYEANLFGSRFSPSQPNRPSSCCSDFGNSAEFHGHNELANNHFPMQFVLPSSDNSLFYPRTNPIEANDSFCSSNIPHIAHLSPHHIEDTFIPYQQPLPNGRARVRVARGSLGPFGREGSLVISGSTRERRPQLDGYPFNRASKFSSLTEAQGYIYHMAKDQQGCRFLQRMFDEGDSIDVLIIFGEIIDHAVELMMNPFGNYLMQKLLEVCNKRQRMRILYRVTEEPGELVRICLNTHGTRVVQKLIETVKVKQEISLVVSALEPGFLALIKDLNGNHVIQRCLQCFNSEDSKFILIAAAKYCVDIATHQHGCCVLQRCIGNSTGEHQENLIAEISANGLQLAEDAYGNYVVQFILDLKIPSATSKLTSQFEGNYVHLSTQKFSSHVVEKCLLVCNDEARIKIIRELVSCGSFEQLIQHPHANYVVQKALSVSEGRIRDSLISAIESYKTVSRNSPYSKKIFSQKVLKK